MAEWPFLEASVSAVMPFYGFTRRRHTKEKQTDSKKRESEIMKKKNRSPSLTLPAVFSSAPASKRSCTIAVEPLLEASISAVIPFYGFERVRQRDHAKESEIKRNKLKTKSSNVAKIANGQVFFRTDLYGEQCCSKAQKMVSWVALPSLTASRQASTSAPSAMHIMARSSCLFLAASNNCLVAFA